MEAISRKSEGMEGHMGAEESGGVEKGVGLGKKEGAI